MAKTSDLEKAVDSITEFFTKVGPKVYSQTDLKNIIHNHREMWQLKETTRLEHFIEFTSKAGLLKQIRLQFPNRSKIRYIFGTCTIHAIAQSLISGGYFSHRSAAELHGLLDSGDQVFFNFEQSSRSQSIGGITQDAIDRAFQNKARITQNKALCNDYTIWLLNGKNTGCYGVIWYNDRNGEILRVTNIARTLIDMAVRPSYSGGPVKVLQAYRIGSELVDGLTIVQTLIALQHTYPYHQAVGYYMEKAGFSPEDLETLKMIPMNFDFYLDNQISNPLYSLTWRLYYPDILDSY